jgi:hypothetical protein
MQIQVQQLSNFNIQVCSVSLVLLKKYGIRYILLSFVITMVWKLLG